MLIDHWQTQCIVCLSTLQRNATFFVAFGVVHKKRPQSRGAW